MSRLFVAMCLLLSGCGGSSDGGAGAIGAITDVKWTTDQIIDSRVTCVASAKETVPTITDTMAMNYCACTLEEASKRWTYDDYLAHETTYTQVLVDDGTTAKCAKLAGITSTTTSTSTQTTSSTAASPKDGTSPYVSLTSMPASLINTNLISWELSSDEDIQTPRCMLDSTVIISCTISTVNPQRMLISYTGLAQGSHTVTASVADGSGNRSNTLQVFFVVDTIPPSITLQTKPALTSTETLVNPCFIFTWTKSSDALVTTSYLDGGTPSEIAVGTLQKQYCITTSGNHTATFTTQDAAGNAATASYSWTFQFRFKKQLISGSMIIEDIVQHLMITTVQPDITKDAADTECNNLVNGGFSDWYLPTSDTALQSMANNNVAAFASVTEVPDTYVWVNQYHSTYSDVSCPSSSSMKSTQSYYRAVNLRTVGSYTLWTHLRLEGPCGFALSGPGTYGTANYVCMRATP